MDVYIQGNTFEQADKKYWFLIGLADEGKGQPGSFFFTKDDLKHAVSNTSVSDVSIWIEHGTATKENIGELVYWWVDENDGLYIVARFEVSLRSSALQNWIRDGLYTGISMGYTTQYDDLFFVKRKNIFEISIVHEPFHPACRIKQIVSGQGFLRIKQALENLSKRERAVDVWDLFLNASS